MSYQTKHFMPVHSSMCCYSTLAVGTVLLYIQIISYEMSVIGLIMLLFANFIICSSLPW